MKNNSIFRYLLLCVFAFSVIPFIITGCNNENSEVLNSMMNKNFISTSGSTVYGNVMSNSGIPLSGATIRIEASTFAKETTTDSTGFFKFEGIGKRKYTLSVTTIGFSDYFETMDLSDENNSVQIENKIIKLNYSGISPAKSVIGRVVEYGTSATIEDAFVKIGNLTARTSVNGSFVITGIENGIYTISAEKENYSSNSKYVHMVNGECITNIEITMFKGTGVINVRVLDDYNENSLVGATVEARLINMDGAIIGEYITDELGSVRIKNAPAGKYKIFADAANYDKNSATVELESGEEIPSLIIKLKGKYASLHGRAFETALNAGIPRLNVIIKETGQSVLTDVSGYFDIPDIRPGKYTLEFTNLYYNEPPYSFTIELDPNERREDLNVYIASHKALGKIYGPILLGKKVGLVDWVYAGTDEEGNPIYERVENENEYSEYYSGGRENIGITVQRAQFTYIKERIVPPTEEENPTINSSASVTNTGGNDSTIVTTITTTVPMTKDTFANDRNVVYRLKNEQFVEVDISSKITLTGNQIIIDRLLPGKYLISMTTTVNGRGSADDTDAYQYNGDYNYNPRWKVQAGDVDYIYVQAGQTTNKAFLLNGNNEGNY